MRELGNFLSVSEELRLFGISCLVGAALGVVFDLFRALRLLVPHNSFLTAAEDIAFLGLYALVFAVFSAVFAGGETRLCYALGNLLGFCIYMASVGSVVTGTLRRLLAALGFLFRPLRGFYSLLRAKLKFIFVGFFQIIVKPFKKSKIVLLNRRLLLYNKMENKKRKNVKSVVEKNET
jgi:hypothetical protein